MHVFITTHIYVCNNLYASFLNLIHLAQVTIIAIYKAIETYIYITRGGDDLRTMLFAATIYI